MRIPNGTRDFIGLVGVLSRSDAILDADVVDPIRSAMSLLIANSERREDSTNMEIGME